jgi:hypothetical protein
MKDECTGNILHACGIKYSPTITQVSFAYVILRLEICLILVKILPGFKFHDLPYGSTQERRIGSFVILRCRV